MRCVICGADNKATKIIETRYDQEGYVASRRRKCDNCGRSFWTLEIPSTGGDLHIVRVQKRDRSLEAFDLGKIRRSLEKSFAKRGLENTEIGDLTSQIAADVMAKVREVESSSTGFVTSEQIGQIVLNALGNRDEVAYVRYAAHFYRDYNTCTEFENILRRCSRELTERRQRGEGENAKS